MIDFTQPNPIWSLPPAELSLGAWDVHVWRTSLLQSDVVLARCAMFLSTDEKKRAQRFYRERDRNRFIAARGQLRWILACYLAGHPGILEFIYSQQGKPKLKLPSGTAPLHFNLSHAQDWALYAVTRQGAIGIDVEQVRPMPDALAMAQRLFTPREQASLKDLDPDDQAKLFFHYWTRKEALVKAMGEGLTEDLVRWEVILEPGESVRELHPDGSFRRHLPWYLFNLFPVAGYQGALAVSVPPAELRQWHLDFSPLHPDPSLPTKAINTTEIGSATPAPA